MARRRFNKRHVLMLRWGAPCVALAAGLSLLALANSTMDDPSAPNADGSITGLTSVLSRDATDDMVRFTFTDITRASGITFTHFPDTRRSLLPEDMGSGVAWADYDNDGDQDVFLVNFCSTIRTSTTDADPAGRCALYCNEGDGTFTDVSAGAGLDVAIHGLGAAWGDFDNDDDVDLYITAYGPNRMFRNEGNGVFVDVTAETGLGDDAFGAGCAWADYDNDGWIDLYVTNYVEFIDREDDDAHTTRQYGSETPYTINPSSYPPAANRLYRNLGDGAFVDVAVKAGVDNSAGRSLGACWFDFDNDGLIDLYVANDVSSNGVFHNMGDGTFADIGAQSLAADYRGAMGLAVGDYERDGDLDLFVTHWIAQENAFFENKVSEQWTDDDGQIKLFFMDTAELIGLGQLSLNMVGWATSFEDFDNDGWLDLWVVNGNTLQDPDDPTRLRPQRTQLFWHKPDEGFFQIGERACPSLETPFVGRGGAAADYDQDGRVDLLLQAHGGAPLLLHNDTDNQQHWIIIRLRQVGGNTRALGARVTVRVGDIVQTSQVGVRSSYLSQSPADLHFGLGDAEVIDELVIYWPDGAVERMTDVASGRILQRVHAASYKR